MFNFDCIVVGAGHAGIEASVSAARLGLKTLLTTLNIDNIGLRPCNPAIGGPAKSNLVREIDALGGVMAELTDATYLQLKTLNSSKGPAVRALRAQSDKKEYRYAARKLIEEEKNLTLKQIQVVDLIVENNEIKGVVDELGLQYFAPTVILTTGTSLEGRIFIGLKWPSRAGIFSYVHLLLRQLQNYNLLLNHHWQGNVGYRQKKIPHVQGQRKSPSKMVGGTKLR